MIVAGGGAGTLRAIAEGLCRSDSRPPDPDHVCAAPLRLGSGNVLAKAFGVPEDPEKALQIASRNFREGRIGQSSVIRCIADGHVHHAMTLVGLGQFGRIPEDLDRWHRRFPTARRALAACLGVERLTKVEYRTAMSLRAVRCRVHRDLMEEVEIRGQNGVDRVRLLAGALASFPVKGLPFKPAHGPADPMLSGLFLADSALSLRHVLSPRDTSVSAWRVSVSEESRIVIRLLSSGSASFFLDEDPLSFRKEVCLDVSGLLGIVPGVVPTDSHVLPESPNEVRYDHPRLHSWN